VLEPLHPIEQLARIRELLHVLMPVRMRDHQLEIIPFGLPPDLVVQPGVLALEEPEHAPGISA
jgi:hypothetical protein